MQHEARADVSPYDANTPECTTAETVLDRIHQAMLLFARGRSDTLKRFLVDDGIGKDAVLETRPVALGPAPAGNRREAWVDGVLLARKGSGYDIPVAQHSTLVLPGKKVHHKRVTTEHTDGHGKGKLIRVLFFRVSQWIPWLISDPSRAAIGCCWTESAVRICADLGCRVNRRSTMYSRISIKNFRGIGLLKADGLRRINPILGRNNSGKTSFLEAYFFSVVRRIPSPRPRSVSCEVSGGVGLLPIQSGGPYFAI